MAIENNAVINMGVQLYFQVKCFYFLWILPKVELLDHTRMDKSRFTIVHMEKDTEVMIIVTQE